LVEVRLGLALGKEPLNNVALKSMISLPSVDVNYYITVVNDIVFIGKNKRRSWKASRNETLEMKIA